MKIVFLGCGYLGFNLSEQLKNEKAEAEDSSFFYRQTDPLT